MEKKTKKISSLTLGKFLLSFIILIIGLSAINNTFSNKTTSTAWDGVTVAASFAGGNGTVSNPYQISNGEELAYFKQQLEGENYRNYNNKHYILTDSINLGDNEFEAIGSYERYFNGFFDGAGYTIYSFTQTKAKRIDNYNYYGLFAVASNATIKNFNLTNIQIQAEELKNTYIGTLIGKSESNQISNVAIYNVGINAGTNEAALVGGIIGEETNSTLANLFISFISTSENDNYVGGVAGKINDVTLENIVINAVIDKSLSDNKNIYGQRTTEFTTDTVYSYQVVNDELVMDQTINIEDVVTNLNNQKETEWYLEDNLLKLRIFKEEIVSAVRTQTFALNSPIVEHASGIVDDTVYVNDLQSDYDYYMGLNYTTSENNDTPTVENKNLYSDSNLVKMQITYSGTETLADGRTLTGYVSKEERQSQYIYYKTLSLNTNNTTDLTDDYVLLELIDNPFTDRPTDKGFNNWVTNFNGTEISYDKDYYVRYAKIPVTYTNGIPDEINIVFTATWVAAKVEEMTTNWANAFSELDTAGIHQLELTRTYYAPYDMTGYFRRVTINRNASVVGYYDSSGSLQTSGTCQPGFFGRTCTYYELIENEDYVEGETYYELLNSRMSQVDNDDLPLQLITETNDQYVDANMAGYYELVTVSNGGSLEGYYDDTGEAQTGTCTTTRGCSYYKLIQYYDEAGYENIYDSSKDYYYLATRDTNIIVFSNTVTTTWGSGQSKPFTLTSVYNDMDYRNSATWTVSSTAVHCYNDTRIENIRINAGRGTENTTPSNGTSNSRYLYGDWNNLKLGRGITQNGTYQNFLVVLGGSNGAVGSSNNISKYRLIIESGNYNSLGLTVGNFSSFSGTSVYVMAQGIYGNDYDRINNNNDNLDIFYCASGSWGGNIYGEATAAVGLDLKVKSGKFGSGKYDNTTGIYIGGRQSGTHYTSRRVVYEGGETYNLIGGPVTATNRANINDSYMYIKGGSIDMITGGAGQTATYGNRIVQLTGGTVNYSVFAGSNGYDGGSSDGTVNGDGYIYLGGTAVVGSDENVSNNRMLFGAEAGSVFGIGNGRSEYTSVGSSDNANIILTGNARVKRNIYGGGNYGATGISSTGDSTKTQIRVHGGTVEGSIYGGGNQNGSGSTSINSLIDILVDDGTIQGSIYGGSNAKGTIYGDVEIKVLGGVVGTDVYGGGYGGYQSSNLSGTYVTGSVDVKIGSPTLNNVTINGSVYGGSAFGTVNGTRTATTANANTDVVVENGIVTNAVYGGGRGSTTYTPAVKGNINVNINGGSIGSVYGGNDASGSPEQDVYVYLNGGVIGNAFGGGNNATVDITNIYLRGATVTNLYGGSNLTGTATKTNVELESGTVTTVYGGNNIGGYVDNSQININGCTIADAVYGGGNEAESGDTHILLNKTDSKIPNIYGGGRQATATSTDINLISGEVENVYGGSNVSGSIATSNITANGSEKLGESGVIMDVAYDAYDATWETTAYKTVVDITVTLKNPTARQISTYDGWIKVNDSAIYRNYSNTDIVGESLTYSFNQKNRYYGNNTLPANGEYSFVFQILTNQDKNAFQFDYGFTGTNSAGVIYADGPNKPLAIDNIYGGNNQGGLTSLANITLDGGTFGNIFGGGNHASVVSPTVIVNGGAIQNIYGGGNLAPITASTTVIANGGKISNNIYGGGNQGVVQNNTDVKIENTVINGSVYAGGNGASAIVNGNTSLAIGGNTVVGTEQSVGTNGSVFGGGNAAATGTEEANSSTATVDIAGATIYGNVYGGANTSVVYGKTFTNIGYNTKDMTGLTKSNIYVRGTIFGGGEANASGSENYDYSFISVTDGIIVNIDGGLYDVFDISGSIFGSGNASSTTGTSEINITNYGSADDIKKNISIQRTNTLTIKNSHFELSGATDRTNEYSDYLYTLSRIDDLKLANNSAIYLQTGANLLKKFTSLKIDASGEEVATVDIDEASKQVTKNIDNRLYILEGKNLNIATNEATTAFGRVEGMTFFGMYTHDRNDVPISGMYNQSYNYGDTATSNDLYLFIKGSYVLGLHHTNHDITKDGFYSNYDDNTQIKVNYIEPTPEDSNFYMWIIGEVVTEYQLNLVASKYSTLGAVELPLLEFSQGNTQFVVLDFNYNGLEEGVSLIDMNDIPRIATTGSEADHVMGLSMRSSNTGWQTNGRTNFLSDDNNAIVGTTTYKSENSTSVPTLLFYLYHSKNLETSGDLGNVTISLMAITRIDDLTNETKRLVINVDMSRALYTTNDYEGGITPGREYSMFAPTLTNITSKSAFSTYYSLYAESDVDLYKTGYHRSLVSSYILPENTEITLIDLSSDTLEYYYYVIDSADVTRANEEYLQHREASYSFNKFRRMGSITESNKYSDEEMNDIYYDAASKVASEEFIVIVDFADTSIADDSINNSLLIELRDQDEQTIISVLGIEQGQIVYNLYANKDAIIELDGGLDNNVIYKEDTANLVLKTNFLQQSNGSNNVYDTNFFDKKLGIKLTILDSEGKQLNGTSLLGLYYEIDGENYYPNIDGTTRIAIADKVANVESRIKVYTSNLNLASGSYTIEINSFASPDGIYYGLDSSDTLLVPFTFVNKVFGLKVTTDEKSVIVNKDSGVTLNGNNSLVYIINYFSGLANPNIRLTMYRRMYDQVYTNQYELVDFKDYVTNNYQLVGDKQYLLSNNPAGNMTMMFNTKTNLKTGTYRLDFSLYDGQNYIGDVKKYLIIE